ncbi:ORF059R [Infectious spleen and kidney necrosis virus]|uniref:ORF059R n=1 Tax=Infectious spleen and kidney necrosis virus (isolate Mandarin fish/China/Nanhai/1998) TaxID=654923 RepID=Q8QUQ1_ISKNN|nr:ORF059R [Infectious spleen and kidney necrosis virus]AAL98783.1 ORF059R [Infectious spleen and kidney necrosis virus]
MVTSQLCCTFVKQHGCLHCMRGELHHGQLMWLIDINIAVHAKQGIDCGL